MATLWDAMGQPPREAWVPSGRSPGWIGPRNFLHAALRAEGVNTRFRSWQALWSALHNVPPPRHLSWGLLLGIFTIADVPTASPPGSARSDPTFFAWNLQWMVDPHSDAAASKRGIIATALLRQRIVCVVETHWSDAASARWGGVFPLGVIASATARPGPNMGPRAASLP